MAPELDAKDGAPKRWVNAVVPISLIVLFVFIGLIFTGLDKTQADPNLSSSVTNIFGNSDSYSALLWSTLAVSIFTWIWLRAQYYVPFDEEFNKSSKIMWFFNKVPGAVPVLKLYGEAPCIAPAPIYLLQSIVDLDDITACMQRSRAGAQ
jgi:hypothetical protein